MCAPWGVTVKSRSTKSLSTRRWSRPRTRSRRIGLVAQPDDPRAHCSPETTVERVAREGKRQRDVMLWGRESQLGLGFTAELRVPHRPRLVLAVRRGMFPRNRPVFVLFEVGHPPSFRWPRRTSELRRASLGHDAVGRESPNVGCIPDGHLGIDTRVCCDGVARPCVARYSLTIRQLRLRCRFRHA
jgi:hypothetical protein